jgi:cytochrome c peroxidase
VNKDNTAANLITDKTATLGRVLFYDKNLSINNTISCASCHKQEFAFGDTAISSLGVENGRTERHSMRLINTRYANEAKFFWNERAASLETQTTMPIQDHLEMGFSGQTGRGNMSSVITKINGLGYYKELFKLAYGDATITEARMQTASATIRQVLNHYNSIGAAPRNTNLDPRLKPNNIGQNLQMTPDEINSMVAFLRTLTGKDVYTNKKWGNPFL